MYIHGLSIEGNGCKESLTLVKLHILPQNRALSRSKATLERKLDLILLEAVKSDVFSLDYQIFIEISPEKPSFSFLHYSEAVEVDYAEIVVVFEAD